MPAAQPPRVAVVIPCFNDGATVGDAVASVLAQDEPAELVVVDDGSTDPATAEAMRELQARGVRVVRQANGGLARARMAGVTATTAPYVLPLDADDLLEPGALRFLADRLDGAPDAGLAWGAYQRFGDESTLQPTAPTLDPWQITFQNELPSTALIRRTALNATPGWRPNGGYEDWDLWMSLAERGWQGLGSQRVIYRYRRRGTRMLHEAAGRHAQLHAALRDAHPTLWARRRSAWRRSRAPLGLRLVLPVLEWLPLSPQQRRLLGGVAAHLAHRRGVGLLVRRIREQGSGTAPRRSDGAGGGPAAPGS